MRVCQFRHFGFDGAPDKRLGAVKEGLHLYFIGHRQTVNGSTDWRSGQRVSGKSGMTKEEMSL